MILKLVFGKLWPHTSYGIWNTITACLTIMHAMHITHIHTAKSKICKSFSPFFRLCVMLIVIVQRNHMLYAYVAFFSLSLTTVASQCPRILLSKATQPTRLIILMRSLITQIFIFGQENQQYRRFSILKSLV